MRTNLVALRAFIKRRGKRDELVLYLTTRGSASPASTLKHSSSSPTVTRTSPQPQSPAASSREPLPKPDVPNLDHDIRNKVELKFNAAHAECALQWIEQVLDTPLSSHDFHGNLKSGEVLCNLLNKIRPGTIPLIHRSNLAFKQMENISTYLVACREVLKMSDTDLFETSDLFKQQNLGSVVTHLRRLASFVRTLPGCESLPNIGMISEYASRGVAPIPDEPCASASPRNTSSSLPSTPIFGDETAVHPHDLETDPVIDSSIYDLTDQAGDVVAVPDTENLQ